MNAIIEKYKKKKAALDKLKKKTKKFYKKKFMKPIFRYIDSIFGAAPYNSPLCFDEYANDKICGKPIVYDNDWLVYLCKRVGWSQFGFLIKINHHAYDRKEWLESIKLVDMKHLYSLLTTLFYDNSIAPLDKWVAEGNTDPPVEVRGPHEELQIGQLYPSAPDNKVTTTTIYFYSL
jgi:hypothetical protein